MGRKTESIRRKLSLVLRASSGANLCVYTNTCIPLSPSKMHLSGRQNRAHYLPSTGDGLSVRSQTHSESHGQKMAGARLTGA